MRAVHLALATGTLAGCFSNYQPGSFATGGVPFAGERATIGCLEVAVSASRDPVARGPVVSYEFGNRCDRAIPVDLGAVRVTGRTAAGEEVAMSAFDPHRELRAAPLDARRAGRERIEYRVARDFSGGAVQVCLDLGGITSGGRTVVTCLATPDVAAPPVPVVADAEVAP
ncbi:MAG TPA: hypothetical protein VM734_19220 [Kofleriaceae bacterium]|nr:hypothetical protein [Kofleriaceae bacterium]